MRSAPQSGFSLLSLRIRARIFREIFDLPGFDFHRQMNLASLRCHPTTVAGRMTCASFLQPVRHFEMTIQRRRNANVNFGLGAFFRLTASTHAASWLSAQSSFAARTAFGASINRANRRT
jgi:hypothetical protein